jgi:hypothetical protein
MTFRRILRQRTAIILCILRNTAGIRSNNIISTLSVFCVDRLILWLYSHFCIHTAIRRSDFQLFIAIILVILVVKNVIRIIHIKFDAWTLFLTILSVGVIIQLDIPCPLWLASPVSLIYHKIIIFIIFHTDGIVVIFFGRS